MLDRWELAKGGEGQLVLLSGEPGIGKSRITDEITRRLGDRLCLLRFQCSPQNVDSALHPIIARFEAAAGISRNDRPGVRLMKLESFLATEFGDASRSASAFSRRGSESQLSTLTPTFSLRDDRPLRSRNTGGVMSSVILRQAILLNGTVPMAMRRLGVNVVAASENIILP